MRQLESVRSVQSVGLKKNKLLIRVATRAERYCNGKIKHQYNTMNKEERNSFRKEMLGKLEEQWAKNNRPEDDLFYYHPSEDKIVLSHSLFWVMTQNIKGKVGKEKYLLLLRQYQEEMLEAWLTESSDFKDLLHYCNVIYYSRIIAYV